jgi:selenocysteine lyase/cysteine desulfurase
LNDSASSFADHFVGIDQQVPLLDGSRRRYTNLDSAASTPPLKSVQRAVEEFAGWYSSVHRGMGFKSQLSTYFFERARAIILDFLGADPAEHTCIFVKNATEGLNILAHRIPFTPARDIVLTSGMEHHSNDLPWRGVAEVRHIKLLADGRLDEGDFDRLLAGLGERVALVAVSGASNVTGYLNPIHRLAAKAHAAGALFAADCAQLAPHRKIEMKPLADPEHVDYAVISAHKMYAPYGSGALVGRQDTFADRAPFMSGGGTVKVVTYDEHVWGSHRDEAGSPNTVGAIALAAAIRALEGITMEKVAQHEMALTTHALARIKEIPGIQVFGSASPEEVGSRLGVIPFLVEGLSHILVAAILGYEFGIGVRNGRFCAYPYTFHMLGLSDEEIRLANARLISGDGSQTPGMVRASLGLYNTHEDVDYFMDALTCIARREYRGIYSQHPESGDFLPAGWSVDFETYFSL